MVKKLAGRAKQLSERTLRLHRLNIGRRLTLCFLFIILALLLGNVVLLWQFHLARAQADRLSGVDQELITILQAQTSLMTFYERLDILAHSENTGQLVGEVEALRSALLQDSRHSRDVLSHLPPEVQMDPALLPTLLSIQDSLPAELEAITALAKANEWKAVRLRLANQVRPLEARSSALVENIDREVGEQRAQALLKIEHAQRQMFYIAPITAGLTLLFAAFLGSAITRSITHPLGRLMEGAAALAKGDFSHRVPAAGNDEIALLGNVFNDMIVRLQELYHELHRNSAYLSQAQELSHTGSFGWDVSSGDINWSAETFRIFEFEPTVKVTIELIWQRTHPEDRSAVQELMERASREKTEFDFEHRLLMPDGSVKHLRVVGHSSMDERRHLEFVGAVTDITSRKRAEGALRRSESYLAEAQKLTRSGSWAWNVHTQEVFWSQEMFRIFAYDPAKVKPTISRFLEMVHSEDRPQVERRAIVESTQKDIGDSEGDFRIVLPNGAIKHLHSIAHPVVNESGEITEVVGTTMDVTEQYAARNALETAFQQIKALKDQLHEENIALREEIDRSSMFEEIVGASPVLHSVLSRIAKVAPTDSSVLITGETGTGKELVARAIHRRSHRSSRVFISVNCAAIPRDLIASELFGHEKGAFTGATQQRLGRFELAGGGTIFLDEVGELPAETQVALLRVLQEREFERVGGTRPIRTEIRVIAATNRDLQTAITAGAFRSDLFYRLNVFPIEIPPLRQRKEDIPLLVEYFIDRFARKAGKRIRAVNKNTLDLLQSYPWPGNIRELQNVVERSVILCDSENFSVDESWLSRQPVATETKSPLDLSEMLAAQEKDLIEAALRECEGQVYGPTGAAAKLGMPRSTLESKIRSLGIDKHRFRT